MYAYFFQLSNIDPSKMARVDMFIVLIFILFLANSTSGSPSDYVQDACSVTTYRDLCIRSLAPFSDTAKRSPTKWARAGVSVTITLTKSVMRYLTQLKRHTHMEERNLVALSDCIEVFQNTNDELHKSLYILRKLTASGFNQQMSDLTTFMSAALTDEDTCLDGFEGSGGKQVDFLRSRVRNATYLTSNALALVNKLATTGLRDLRDWKDTSCNKLRFLLFFFLGDKVVIN